jgi:zinc D-Ala-D-Ala carboxypeptidase
MDWTKYPNFTESEFACKHTGKNAMKPEFMDKLQALRTEYGRPMTISSGYRHPSHPIERGKTISGEHSSGLACDVAVHGADAYRIIQLAIKHGFTRIGVQQKGTGRFIHLGMSKNLPNPTIWSY